TEGEGHDGLSQAGRGRADREGGGEDEELQVHSSVLMVGIDWQRSGGGSPAATPGAVGLAASARWTGNPLLPVIPAQPPHHLLSPQSNATKRGRLHNFSNFVRSQAREGAVLGGTANPRSSSLIVEVLNR